MRYNSTLSLNIEQFIALVSRTKFSGKYLEVSMVYIRGNKNEKVPRTLNRTLQATSNLNNKLSRPTLTVVHFPAPFSHCVDILELCHSPYYCLDLTLLYTLS